MAKQQTSPSAAADRQDAARLLGGHWRPPLAGVVGAVVGYVAGRLGLLPGAATLLGWDVAAVVFLATTGWMLLTDDADDLRRRACLEDEPPLVLSILVIAAMTFGFAAIVIAMREGASGGAKGGAKSELLGMMAVATLVLSWLSLQALFTLHYAHRYFGDPDRDGETGQGFEITGDKPNTYRDFIYMAVCIGACFQVSDFGPTNTKFRNLITVHALISFAFNALVISLGVSIVGDLLKG